MVISISFITFGCGKLKLEKGIQCQDMWTDGETRVKLNANNDIKKYNISTLSNFMGDN